MSALRLTLGQTAVTLRALVIAHNTFLLINLHDARVPSATFCFTRDSFPSTIKQSTTREAEPINTPAAAGDTLAIVPWDENQRTHPIQHGGQPTPHAIASPQQEQTHCTNNPTEKSDSLISTYRQQRQPPRPRSNSHSHDHAPDTNSPHDDQHQAKTPTGTQSRDSQRNGRRYRRNSKQLFALIIHVLRKEPPGTKRVGGHENSKGPQTQPAKPNATHRYSPVALRTTPNVSTAEHQTRSTELRST